MSEQSPQQDQFVIYHNPRCSKSRQTLALLQEHGVEPEQVLYLDNPPDAETLKRLLKALGISARALLRKGEEEYKTFGLSDKSLSEGQLIDAIAAYPRLMERPVVVKGDRAVLGRPPENVLSLLS